MTQEDKDYFLNILNDEMFIVAYVDDTNMCGFNKAFAFNDKETALNYMNTDMRELANGKIPLCTIHLKREGNQMNVVEKINSNFIESCTT